MNALCQPRSDQNVTPPPLSRFFSPNLVTSFAPQTAVHDETRSYGSGVVNVALMSEVEGRALIGRCPDDPVLIASNLPFIDSEHHTATAYLRSNAAFPQNAPVFTLKVPSNGDGRRLSDVGRRKAS
jgi:hypothetical protein